MIIRNWLQAVNKRSSKSKRLSAARQRYRIRPALERLEDRIQPTTNIVVTGIGDGPSMLTGSGEDFQDTTLRGAIEAANNNAVNADPGSTVDINFAKDLVFEYDGSLNSTDAV